jgi:BirA family biotin operon repressor/biotin-[acetyl-CoA-carboxylase] ligase
MESEPLPAELSEALAAAGDRLQPLGRRVVFFESIGSTNDIARAMALEDGAEGAVVLANGQTAGRGRYGRSWFSPAGSGLYVSVVLNPSASAIAPRRAGTLLTLAAGVAMAEAIESATGLSPDIKWPNDLLIARRKLAGILAEAAGHGSPVVLGYGINVRESAYPPDLRDRATSVERELGRPIDRSGLCVETLAALAHRYRDLLDGRFDVILDSWRRRSPASDGAPVSWRTASGTRSGTTAGIDDDGALLVRVGERLETILGGEVAWL